MQVQDFQKMIREFAVTHTRTMPWRSNTSPYYVFVSEIMLQQTQVDRVVPKFELFIQTFPDVEALAKATLSDVLKVWNGLGYPRRAKFLWHSAQIISEQHGGVVPSTLEALVKLPGVGTNTAGAVLTYAYNQPVVFVETNIRTVYLHHFFADKEKVSDKEIEKIVFQTLDIHAPREWYWALMDYGTYLKKQGIKHLARSAHYKKQATFKGSVRQMRGNILRALSSEQPLSKQQLQTVVQADERFDPALTALIQESFVKKTGNLYRLH